MNRSPGLDMKHLIAEAGFTAEVVAEKALEKGGWRVEYFIFRLKLAN